MSRVVGPVVLVGVVAYFWFCIQIDALLRSLPEQLIAILGFGRHEILHFYTGVAKILAIAVPLAAFEILTQRTSQSRLRDVYLRPLVIWLGFYAMATLAVSISGWIRSALGIAPIFSASGIPAWLHLVIYIVLIDFLGYWFHRTEHAIPFLWQFHSTHHSIEELGALNQYEHWFEGMFRFFFVYLPATLIMAPPNLSQSVIALVFAAWTVYAHSNSPLLTLPPWARKIFADNLYHHYHHGRDASFHDRNFGNMFSIWDKLFGTRLMPVSGSFPKTGLHEISPPKTLIEFVAHPFLPRFRRQVRNK